MAMASCTSLTITVCTALSHVIQTISDTVIWNYWNNGRHRLTAVTVNSKEYNVLCNEMTGSSLCADREVVGCVATSTVAGVINVGGADKLKVVVVRLHVGVLVRRQNII